MPKLTGRPPPAPRRVHGLGSVLRNDLTIPGVGIILGVVIWAQVCAVRIRLCCPLLGTRRPAARRGLLAAQAQP
eukprot:3701329-Lingulodinium_polyedra.AAC.1